jgi:hypothetical protein
VDATDGTLLATATGVYVAADAARKQELAARYGVRRLRAPEVPSDAPDLVDVT